MYIGLSAISLFTELMIQDITMLLHLPHALVVESMSGGRTIVPLMNPNLFFTLNETSIALLQEL